MRFVAQAMLFIRFAIAAPDATYRHLTWPNRKEDPMSRSTRAVAFVVAFFVAVLGAALAAPSASAAPASKVYVCKYVGKPGVDERLQTGQNPILVSANATSGAQVGQTFNDKQGLSLVLAVDTDGTAPTAADCMPATQLPKPVNPPLPAGATTANGTLSPSAPHSGDTGGSSPLNGWIAATMLVGAAGAAAAYRRSVRGSRS